MSIRKVSYCFLIVALSITGCTDDHLNPGTPPDTISFGEGREDELKDIFGRGVAKAFAESISFRKLIKEKALEMFDRDYDVLYHLIKNEDLDNGGTVRDLLLKHIGEEELSEIERTIPLLTLFVPELPENTFSASLWNVTEQIPVVGITSNKTNNVNIINSDGDAYVLPCHVAPGFPVVVVKECERVVVTEGGKSTASGRTMSGGGVSFQFLGDCFDGSLKIAKSDQEIGATQTSSNGRLTALSLTKHLKLMLAYTAFPNTNGWQRDYMYYNLTPEVTKGPFVSDIVEHITLFRLRGDAVSAYQKISDQTSGAHIDPKFQEGYWWDSRYSPQPSVSVGWTGGYFEFRVTVTMNSKISTIGNQFIAYFHATPVELFDMRWVRPSAENPYFYYLKIMGTKDKYTNLQLFPWDLESYSSTIKIEIEEIDEEKTVNRSETRTSKVADNFGFDAGFGEVVKLGLKYGKNVAKDKTQTLQWTETQGSDKLGSVILNFGDRFITGTQSDGNGGTLFNVPEYTTGWYSIMILPMQR